MEDKLRLILGTVNDNYNKIGKVLDENDVVNNKLSNPLENNLNKLESNFHSDMVSLVRPKLIESKKRMKSISIDIESLDNIYKEFSNSNLKNIEFDKFLQLSEKINHDLQKIRTKVNIVVDTINQSDEMKSYYHFSDFLSSQINNINDWTETESLVKLLKNGNQMLEKEIKLYRELAATGLAAELTNHEFNSLNLKVREDLQKLKRSLHKTKVIPLIDRILTGFRSLERLYRKISPLYRQTRHQQKNISIKEMINNVFLFYQEDIRRYKISIENNVPESFIIKEAEPILFSPLVNLISNAIYWLINSDNRKIVFYADSANTVLYVNDNGPGISKKNREKIFEPFFTLRSEGRGLGLYLSRDILQSKNHELLLEYDDNIKKLNGACFTIIFSEDSIERRV